MYIEDTGAGDGDIKVTVEGEEYTAEANYDLDGDGVDETVAIMTDDGFVAYVDEDGDGDADVMQTIDDSGTVVGQARFDEATGDWVSEDPSQHPPDGDTHDQDHAESMVVDTPDGDREVGPATEDTDGDGVADTAVVETGNGTMLVTDVDGDGSADQVVEVENSGDVTVSEHTGVGEWTVVEEGHINPDGKYVPDAAASATGTDDNTWTFDEDPKDHGGTSSSMTDAGFSSVVASDSDTKADSDSVWS